MRDVNPLGSPFIFNIFITRVQRERAKIDQDDLDLADVAFRTCREAQKSPPIYRL